MVALSQVLHRSLATAVRISLGAALMVLGWLLFSGTTAQAQETGPKGLLETVTAVVQPQTPDATAPVSRLLDAVPAAVEPVKAKVETVTQLPLATTTAPVIEALDETITNLPVAGKILPANPVATVAEPVLTVVDAVAAPVRDLPLPSVPPVLETPAEIIDPLIPAPVPAKPEIPVQETPAQDSPAQDSPALVPPAEGIPAVEAPTVDAPAVNDPPESTTFNWTWFAAQDRPEPHPAAAGITDADFPPAGGTLDSPAPLPSANSNAGNGSTSGSVAADTGHELSPFVFAYGHTRPGIDFPVPGSPALDPGSTPD